MRAAFSASYLPRQDDGFDFSRCGSVQSCDNLVKSTVMAGERVANWASTCLNHTSGRVVQKGGSLMEMDEIAAGATAGAGGRRA